MAKKEYIGLTYEENRIRIARIRVRRKGLELVEVDTLELPHAINSITESGLGDLDFSEDYEEIFEMDDPSASESATGFEDLDESGDSSEEETESAGLEDSFDMTKTEREEDSSRENEQLLGQYISQYGNRKIRVGIHIPFGRTTFQLLKNADPESMKKRDRLEFFRDKLQTTTDQEIDPDHYSWIQLEDNSCLLAHYPDENNFLNLLELSETYLNQKVLIEERLPDEAIWAGLARTNYSLKEDDITGLIAIGKTSSRIIFMRGERIVNVLPVITEGEESNEVLNTIFSKILFEIDKGDLPKITRLLLVQSAKLSEKAKRYLQQQFEEVEIDYLTPSKEHLTYSDEILDSPVYLQPYLTAIGAAWAASKIHEKEFSELSLLPEYILEKQRVLKLEWHGIAILVLIALTPLYLNYLYQTKSSELSNLQQEIQLLDSQMEEIRPTATMTQDLMSEITELNQENERLTELSQYSQQWSQTFQLLNQGVNNISGLWLESFTSGEGNNLTFDGYALNRSVIPAFSRLFTDANILQVTESEIREQTVYTFSMGVNNIRQDVDPFLLELPQRSFDAEQESEVEINFSENDTEEETQPENPEIFISENQTSSPDPANDNTGPASVQDEQPIDPEPSGNLNPSTPSSSADDDNLMNENNAPPNEPPPIVEDLNQSSYGLMGPEDEMLEGAYTVVLHSIRDGERATQEIEKLRGEGYKATLWDVTLEDNRQWWRIGVGQFPTVSAALEAVEELPAEYRERNFIIRIREGQ